MTDETKNLLLPFRSTRSEERRRMAFVAVPSPGKVAAIVYLKYLFAPVR
jgi:hypothetical protein